MVDEIASTSVPAAPAAEVVATPASPVTETPVAPPVEATPVAEPAQTETAPAAEPTKTETPTEAKKTDTLLGSEKKAEEKPAEVKSETKTEEKPAEEVKPVELPKYEIKLPEGVTIDDAKFGEFTKTLAEFETLSKSPHEEVQKLGQQLVERHITELNDAMTRYTESLTQAWNKQKTDWKDSFLKDPEFANRTDTVVNAAIDAIGIYAGNAKQQQEFRELMESTGVGNHPAMIRTLSNIILAKAEPKPLAAPQIATAIKGSKIERMYGAKKK